MKPEPVETFVDSDHLCRVVLARHGPVVPLAFSCGKDSVAAWLQLQRHGFTVCPTYRYIVPGLRFVEDNLRYYESWFQRPILRVPDGAFYNLVQQGIYMPPHAMDVVDGIRWAFRPGAWDDAMRLAICQRWGFPTELPWAVGWRAHDSFRRRMVMKTHGTLRLKAGEWYPCYDWTDKRLVQEVEAAGLKLPSDYSVFPRSFELKPQFLATLREVAPDDYERVRAWFPLIGAVLARRRFYEAEGLEAEAAWEGEADPPGGGA